MKKYEKPASQTFEMRTAGAPLALSVIGNGSVASPDTDVLSNRKGWSAEDWSGAAAEALDD